MGLVWDDVTPEDWTKKTGGLLVKDIAVGEGFCIIRVLK